MFIHNIAPVCLFTFNRLDTVRETVEALKKNRLADKTKLYVFSDGARNEEEQQRILEVRKYIHTIEGFQTIEIFTQEKNRGLANSIIHGVNEVISQYGSVIVLEDDIKTSPNFLMYINHALEHFKTMDKVFSVTGYNPNLMKLALDYPYDAYFSKRFSSWGWATWENRWEKVDWEVKDYEKFRHDSNAVRKFSEGGSDIPKMLKKQMEGKINSWAIRCCYHQYKHQLLTSYASTSKILNIGFGNNSTHTRTKNTNAGSLDDSEKTTFNFPNHVIEDEYIFNRFRAVYSLKNRAINKLKHYLKIN
jgi:hypothetical protein